MSEDVGDVYGEPEKSASNVRETCTLYAPVKSTYARRWNCRQLDSGLTMCLGQLTLYPDSADSGSFGACAMSNNTGLFRYSCS